MNRPTTFPPSARPTPRAFDLTTISAAVRRAKTNNNTPNIMRKTLLITLLLAAGALAGCHSGHDHVGGSSSTAAQLCPVSGEALGSMGEPVVAQHEGQEVKLCCESCRPKFVANPAKYLPKAAK